MNALPSIMRLPSARSLHTTAIRAAARSRDPSSSASQPVFKRDAPPAPAPPARAARPVRGLPSTPGSGGTNARAGRGGKPGSVYASYQALPYDTKLVFWACGAMFATLGLLAADKLEELFPARNRKSTTAPQSESGARFIDHETASQEQKEGKKPKLFSISVVDRSS